MRNGVDRSADGKIVESAVAKTHTNPGADAAAAPSAAFESDAIAHLRITLSCFFAKTRNRVFPCSLDAVRRAGILAKTTGGTLRVGLKSQN